MLDMFVRNKALLMKNLHKFYNRANIPWVYLIWESYTVMEGSLELMWKDLFGGRKIWAWLITLNPMSGVMWGMEGVCSFGPTLGILGVFKLFPLIYFLLPMINDSQTIRCFSMSIWKIFSLTTFYSSFW